MTDLQASPHPDGGAMAPSAGTRSTSRSAQIISASLLVAAFGSSFDLFAVVAVGIAAVIALVRLATRARLDPIGWAVVAFLAWTAVLGAAVGAAPHLGSIREFVAFEGRPFVALLPLIGLLTLHTTPSDVDRVVTQFRVVVVAGGALYLAGLAGVTARPGRTFHGLTSSHHSAGMLFATGALVLLVSARRRPLVDPACGVLALGLTAASGSRTSLVGLLLAAVYLLVTAGSFSRRARNLLTIVALGALALLLSGRAISTIEGIGSTDFTAAAVSEFSDANTAETGKGLGVTASNREVGNALKRFGVWRGGMDEFLRSPVVGIGSWRLNDVERSYTGIHGVVEVSHQAESVHGQGFGAHNAVIQIAAETGLVGVVLFGRFWVLLWRRIRRLGESPAASRAGRAILVFGLGTALTSNALLSPALCFPLFAFCGTLVRCSTDSSRA